MSGLLRLDGRDRTDEGVLLAHVAWNNTNPAIAG
jgi:hypothetical protein